MKKQYSYADFDYSANIDLENKTIDFAIENKEKSEIPKFLYKYYSFNKYSVDALMNSYLFASHPMMINDKYDCSSELVDYSNLDKTFFVNFLAKELKMFSEERIEQLYNPEDKWILERTFADLNQLRLFMKFGVISLTENEKDDLMWAYYSLNSGFVLKLDTSLLPKELFGPFPINYIEEFNKIDITKSGSELAVLYQTNVKQKKWEGENEWRYVYYNEHGKYHPFYWSKDVSSRFVHYNTKAIKEIILGYDFFNPKEIDYSKRTQEYDIMNLNSRKSKNQRKLKKRFLNHILNHEIPTSQIVRNREDYILDAKELKIEKLSPNRYKVFNIFKSVVT